MKWHIAVNQPQALALGIDNINMAHIFDLLMSASTWSDPVTVDKDVYYWVARQKICSSLPLLKLKEDTVYRHLKSLAKLGVIDYTKQGKKDLIKITKKGKEYLLKDSQNTMSEINPNYYVGNKSENNSEINPTYTNTNTNSNNIKNNKKRDDNFRRLVKRLQASSVTKSKAEFTTKGSKLFEAIGKSEDEVVTAYLAHYNSQREVKFAKRIARFLELFDEIVAETNSKSTHKNQKSNTPEEGSFDWMMQQQALQEEQGEAIETEVYCGN